MNIEPILKEMVKQRKELLKEILNGVDTKIKVTEKQSGIWKGETVCKIKDVTNYIKSL